MRETIDIKLTSRQREILIGTILGDGYLEFDGFHGTRLQVKQSEKYKEYVLWLFEELKNLCSSSPKQKSDNFQWYFGTRYLSEFTKLHKLFYPERKKIVPENISDLLNSSLSLAVWYMDDGYLDYRPKDHYAFVLNTDSFLLDEVERLRNALWDNFEIESTVHNPLCRGKRYPKLYIGARGRDRFLETVRPYILSSCFLHKIPPL